MDAAKKLAFVKETIRNLPEAFIPFNRLSEIQFLEDRLNEYRGELARRRTPGIPIRVFYSYSRIDEPLLLELDRSFLRLKAESAIETYWDRHIDPGSDWYDEISEELRNADIILALVTPNFLASQYCQQVELPIAVDLHDCGLAKLVPVLLQPSGWQDTMLSRFQAIPRDCRPVGERANLVEAWAEILASIQGLVDEIRGRG